jgi:hypothetical protein
MWFAALGNVQRQPWLVHLAYHLLQGTPEVLALLPPGQPVATSIRAQLYHYRYTFLEDEPRTWWTRRRASSYFGPLTLSQLADIRTTQLQYGRQAPFPDSGLARVLAGVRLVLGTILGADGGKLAGAAAVLAGLGLAVVV